MTRRTAVVLAGGLGTRIRSVTHGLIPKVLVPVKGVPFIDYKLMSLVEMGVDRAVVLVGELGDQVENYVRRRWSGALSIDFAHDGNVLLGTGGSIAKVRQHLDEAFWVTYGDSYVKSNLVAAEHRARSIEMAAILTVWRNRDSIELSNTTVVDERVVRYTKATNPSTHEWIDYGLIYLPRDAFSSLPTDTPTDLGSVIQALIDQEQMMAWEVSERFWDVGSPEALAATESHFSSHPRKSTL